jgi:hypothetical protein
MTTPRQNILSVFRHEAPAWIPICGHCDPWNQPSREGMAPELAEAMGTVTWRDHGTVTLSRYLGLDIMDFIGPPVAVTRREVSVESTRDGADTISTWHTPAGTLREVVRLCREDGTSYRVEHMVKGPDDLPALAAIFQDATLTVDQEALQAIAARSKLIGDDGILMCFLAGTPVGMMYRVYSGVGTLAYLYTDARQALADLFSVMEQHYREWFSLTCRSGVDALVGMDDTSTTVISPAMFEAFNLGCTDGRADICHEAGKLYFHHSCGLIRDLLPLYRQTKMDAVHAFTVPPIGDVTIAAGRERLGDGITIIAGVAPLADVHADAATMRQGVKELFEGAPRDHLILSLAAYPHKTVEQTRAVLDECRKYQRPS